jgi:hypothetical protein
MRKAVPLYNVRLNPFNSTFMGSTFNKLSLDTLRLANSFKFAFDLGQCRKRESTSVLNQDVLGSRLL